eukprot:scaffold130476_cov49-Attheya_sp.AAC.3
MMRPSSSPSEASVAVCPLRPGGGVPDTIMLPPTRPPRPAAFCDKLLFLLFLFPLVTEVAGMPSSSVCVVLPVVVACIHR